MKSRKTTLVGWLYMILLLLVMGYAGESDYQDAKRMQQIGPQDYRVHVLRGE